MIKSFRSFLDYFRVVGCFVLILLISGVSFAESISKEYARQTAGIFLSTQKSAPIKVMSKSNQQVYEKRVSAEFEIKSTKKFAEATVLSWHIFMNLHLRGLLSHQLTQESAQF